MATFLRGAMASFEVRHFDTGRGEVTLQLVGELDGHQVHELAAAVGALGSEVVSVCLDCTLLDFLDAGGLRAILAAEQRLGIGRLHVVGARRNVRRVFEICRLEHLLRN